MFSSSWHDKEEGKEESQSAFLLVIFKHIAGFPRCQIEAIQTSDTSWRIENECCPRKVWAADDGLISRKGEVLLQCPGDGFVFEVGGKFCFYTISAERGVIVIESADFCAPCGFGMKRPTTRSAGDLSDVLISTIAEIELTGERTLGIGVVGDGNDHAEGTEIRASEIINRNDLEAVGKDRCGRTITTLVAGREGYSYCDKSTEIN